MYKNASRARGDRWRVARPSTQRLRLRRLEIRFRFLLPFGDESQARAPPDLHAERSVARRLCSRAPATEQRENASSIRGARPVSLDNQTHVKFSYRKKSPTRRQSLHFLSLQNKGRQLQPST